LAELFPGKCLCSCSYSRLQAGTDRRRRKAEGLVGHNSLMELSQLAPGVE